MIDVGINRLDDGTIVGDVDLNQSKRSRNDCLFQWVGPMTLPLMEQTVDLAEWSAEINDKKDCPTVNQLTAISNANLILILICKKIFGSLAS